MQKGRPATTRSRVLIAIILVLILTIAGVIGLWWLQQPITNITQERAGLVYEMLSSEPLNIEIIHHPDYRPSGLAVFMLEQRIRQYSENGLERDIDLSMKEIDEGYLKEGYQKADVQSIEAGELGLPVRYNIHILYLNGMYLDNPTAVGTQYDLRSIVIWKEIIEAAVEPEFPFTVDDYESSVLVHEWGHLIGLVNRGYTSNFQYEDSNHPHHDISPRSVMHWSVEYVGITAKPPTDFGAFCQKDIQQLKQSVGIESKFDTITNIIEGRLMEISLIIIALAATIVTSIYWRRRGCKRWSLEETAKMSKKRRRKK